MFNYITTLCNFKASEKLKKKHFKPVLSVFWLTVKRHLPAVLVLWTVFRKTARALYATSGGP